MFYKQCGIITNKPKFIIDKEELISKIREILSGKNPSLSTERQTTGIQSSLWTLSSQANLMTSQLLTEQRKLKGLYSPGTVLRFSDTWLGKAISALIAASPGRSHCLSPGLFPQISRMEPLQESPLILTAENLNIRDNGASSP